MEHSLPVISPAPESMPCGTHTVLQAPVWGLSLAFIFICFPEQ